MAVCASTELSCASLEEVLARTGGLHDVITNRTMADFVPRCGNEGPDVASLEVQGAGTSTRDAIADLSQMPQAARLIGVSSRRQSARHAGEPRRLGMPKESPGRHGVPLLAHQLRVDHAVGKIEGHRLSLQSRSAPSQSDPVSIAFHRGVLESDSAPVRGSRPDPSSSA